MPIYIYHICLTATWKAYLDAGIIAPDSLSDEGFIHCSFQNQVYQTIQRFFPEEDVVVLEIDPAKFEMEVKIEDTSGHGNFPHVYKPISTDAVINIKEAREFIAL